MPKESRRLLFAAGLLCLLSCLVLQSAESQPENETRAARTRRVIAYCCSLSFRERSAYISQLQEQGNLESLTAIYKSNLHERHAAATAIVQLLPAPEAVAFCRSHKQGSGLWRSALHALGSHRRCGVIAYLNEVANSADPTIRVFAYFVCIRTGWDDLVEQARADRYCTVRVPIYVNTPPWPYTVGSVAREYLGSIGMYQGEEGPLTYFHPSDETQRQLQQEMLRLFGDEK